MIREATLKVRTRFAGLSRHLPHINSRSWPPLLRLSDKTPAVRQLSARLSRLNGSMLRSAIVAAVVLVLVVLNLQHATGNDRPGSKRFCNQIRDAALDECAIAFEDSYYKGGFSGKDMDFRLIKDNSRCQKLGTDMYFSCMNNK
jgi:hypothetical protein